MKKTFFYLFLAIFSHKSMSMDNRAKSLAILQLSEKRKEIICESWKIIAENKEILGNTVLSFYEEFKNKHDQLGTFFSYRNENTTMGKFIKMISIMVRSIENPEEVIEKLKFLGILHSNLHLKMPEYQKFAAIFSKNITNKYFEIVGVNASYTQQEVLETWEKLIKKVSKVMLIYQNGGLNEINEQINGKNIFKLSKEKIFIYSKKYIPTNSININTINTVMQTRNSIRIIFDYDENLPDYYIEFRTEKTAKNIVKIIEKIIDINNHSKCILDN